MPPARKSITVPWPPGGFHYQKDFVGADEEVWLISNIEKLSLKEFEFHGYFGKRRTASFGWHYDFDGGNLESAEMIPGFLLELRERAARLAGLAADDFPHVLVTEYSPGTPIGWHRDKAVFEDIVGVSLLSRCSFRFRKKTFTGWERHTVILEPRSVYLLRGQVRNDWEHSIPPVNDLRYSITFRSLRR